MSEPLKATHVHKAHLAFTRPELNDLLTGVHVLLAGLAASRMKRAPTDPLDIAGYATAARELSALLKRLEFAYESLPKPTEGSR